MKLSWDQISDVTTVGLVLVAMVRRPDGFVSTEEGPQQLYAQSEWIDQTWPPLPPSAVSLVYDSWVEPGECLFVDLKAIDGKGNRSE